MRRCMRIGVAAVVLLLSGCYTPGVVSDATPNRSLVYAYFDLSDADVAFDFARLRQVLPVVERPLIRMRVERDPDNRYAALVWFEDLAPGSYQMADFGGERKVYGRKTKVTLGFGGGSNETSVRIEKPGIYFLGAYRYRAVPGSMHYAAPFAMRGKFELGRLESPTPTDLLKRLLTAARGSNWEPRIRLQLQGGAI